MLPEGSSPSYLQAGVFDFLAPGGLTVSNAVQVTIGSLRR